uniref:Caspase 1 n=1 Tax=Nannospalax galili TaxID=1026970 RepID=A0A8C6W7H1_NANGA
PQACQICIAYICEEDCHLAETLGLSAGKSCNLSKVHSSTKEKQNKEEEVHVGPSGSLKLCPLERAQSMWKERSSEIYPISDRSTRTRLALIICNIEFEHLSRRAGADVDLRDMEILLQDLGYTVKVKENLTALEMTTEVMAFADCPEHKTSDSTFLVFMSHGIRDGICGRKYSEKFADVLQVNTIFQMMNTRNCPSMKDKPKVIIIQACRGGNQGVVWVKDSVEDCVNRELQDPDFEDDGVQKAHIEKDFIAFCSSTPDNVSWRHPVRGSLFIMNLIKYMKEHAWSCDLEEIFRKVRFSFEKTECGVQMPTTERVTLTKSFYLFPGL